MTEGELIEAILATKSGDREFMLTHKASRSKTDTWCAAIGNNSHLSMDHALSQDVNYVEFFAYGSTAKEALEILLKDIEEAGVPADTFSVLCEHVFGHGWRWRAATELKVDERLIDKWIDADAIPHWAMKRIAGLVK